MNYHQYVAYGVRLISGKKLPLRSSFAQKTDREIKLDFIRDPEPGKDEISFFSPAVEMHGRSISLGSNMPMEKDWNVPVPPPAALVGLAASSAASAPVMAAGPG